jgi:chemotaxis protein histidine kinase CheA
MAIKKTIEIDVIAPNAQSQINNITRGLNEASQGGQNLTNSLSKSDMLKGKLTSITDGIAGLNPAFAGAAKGANSLLLKMWEIVANPVGAIIAAVVISLKFLYEAFQSSIAGGKEIKQVFAGISAVGEQVKDAIFGLGRALINVTTAAYKFITLDFAGAAEDIAKANGEATESFKQLANASDGTTFTIIKNLEKRQQANNKAKKNQEVAQSEIDKLLVQSREILTDETASINDKKKALDIITKAENAFSKEKVRTAAEDLKIAQEKAKALGGEAEKKKKQELRDLTIDLNRAETENAMTGIKLNKQRKMLLRQETADQKEAIDAQKTALKERQDAEKAIIEEKLKDTKLSFDKQRELVKNDQNLSVKDRKDFLKKINEEERKSIDEHKKALLDLENKYATDIENLLATTDQQKLDLQKSRDLKELENVAKTEEEKAKLKLSLDEKYKILQSELNTKTEKDKADKQKAINDKEIADAKTVADAKVAIQLQGLNALGDLVGLAKSLGEKNKDLQRAALIAESAIGISKIIINTQAANAAARLKYALIPGGAALAATESILNKVSAGIGIAANVAATAKGLAALGGGGAASGGGSNPAGGGGGSSAPQFNIVGQSSTNQLSQTIANQQKQPIKTYVVAGDVTTQQSLDRNAVQTSTFGG